MTVHLVGAGPGDPELLTVRAARLIREAEVIVHDSLVDSSVLALARPGAELVDVGKKPGRPTPQELINALLVHLGAEGRNVVRLKGGDPYVFGRGGEEADALRSAGIDFTVVPGVSSAISAPAAAGIPVTHRGVSVGFTVVTGHRESGGSSSINWEALAQVGGTIVVLMGVAQRGDIAAQLADAGLSLDTPVAAVHRATTGDETVVRCALRELATTPIESPAVLVIGAVASLDVRSIAAELRS